MDFSQIHLLHFPAILDVLASVIFVIVAIGFAVCGPARWVKTCTALCLVCFAASVAAHMGLRFALAGIAFVLGLMCLSMSAGLLMWRYPSQIRYEPAEEGSWPNTSIKKQEKWIDELDGMGFEIVCRRSQTLRLMGKNEKEYMCFYKHAGKPYWMVIYVVPSLKTVAREIVSDKGAGHSLHTMDQQSDAEFFHDQPTVTQRVPGKSSCEEMIALHEKMARDTTPPDRRVENVEEAHRQLDQGWVNRLLESGQFKMSGKDWVAVPAARIPTCLFRTFSAWFH